MIDMNTAVAIAAIVFSVKTIWDFLIDIKWQIKDYLDRKRWAKQAEEYKAGSATIEETAVVLAETAGQPKNG